MNQSQIEHDPHTGEVPNGAAMVRTGVTSSEIQQVTETASVALAARETADVQARHAMARRFPRVYDDVHRALMKACERPTFALSARYKRPQGYKKEETTGKFLRDEKGNKIPNFIEGPSIRFIEECVRLMGNFDVSVETTYDDHEKRLLKIRALDLESNAAWPVQVHVEKTIERRFLSEGAVPLRTRRNTYGDVLYIFAATEDEVTVKQNALVSKAARTAAQRLIPSDLIEDGQTLATKTRDTAIRDGVMKDPAAARKELVAKFDALGVRAADLMEYLGGKPLDGATPDQIIELRVIGAAIKDGEGQWREYLATSPYREHKDDDAKETTPAAKKAADLRAQVEQKKSAAKAKVDAKAKAKPADPAATATPPTEPTPAADAKPAEKPAEAPTESAPTGRQPGDD